MIHGTPHHGNGFTLLQANPISHYDHPDEKDNQDYRHALRSQTSPLASDLNTALDNLEPLRRALWNKSVFPIQELARQLRLVSHAVTASRVLSTGAASDRGTDKSVRAFANSPLPAHFLSPALDAALVGNLGGWMRGGDGRNPVAEMDCRAELRAEPLGFDADLSKHSYGRETGRSEYLSTSFKLN